MKSTSPTTRPAVDKHAVAERETLRQKLREGLSSPVVGVLDEDALKAIQDEARKGNEQKRA